MFNNSFEQNMTICLVILTLVLLHNICAIAKSKRVNPLPNVIALIGISGSTLTDSSIIKAIGILLILGTFILAFKRKPSSIQIKINYLLVSIYLLVAILKIIATGAISFIFIIAAILSILYILFVLKDKKDNKAEDENESSY